MNHRKDLEKRQKRKRKATNIFELILTWHHVEEFGIDDSRAEKAQKDKAAAT